MDKSYEILHDIYFRNNLVPAMLLFADLFFLLWLILFFFQLKPIMIN